MNKEKYERGFSPLKEEDFLRRVPKNAKEATLAQELKTQLAEDFGLVKFTLRYEFKDGKIIDPISGQEIVELTSRGGVKEETESISTIEAGLRSDPKKTWIHFSPKNDDLNYPENCVDFWRITKEGEVVWNRLVVNNDLENMNRVRRTLKTEEFPNEREMMRHPVAVEMKLSEIFDLFSLSQSRYYKDFEHIENIVEQHLIEFRREFGSKLTGDSDLIFRLYSACHKFLNEKQEVVSRRELNTFMYGQMVQMVREKSYGCSVSTSVGLFGEKIGYYVDTSGRVSYGEIPEGYKECQKCGCFYIGEKCPFC